MIMSRTADYTIQGFIYQFNKSLSELLDNEDEAKITIEGIIEDVEVEVDNNIEAIQCKYHEAEDSFTLSNVYKPILQMMEHYYDNGNHVKDIYYKLYVFFPNEKNRIKKISIDDINTILSSNNQKYSKYIKKLKDNINIEGFIDIFCLEFGDSLSDLVKKVCNQLEENEMPKDEIETLIYPNAIQKIADISINHDLEKRKVSKKEFLDEIKKIRKTAITRWTMALQNRKKILRTRKKQLKSYLSQNSRLRYFIISKSTIDNFEECIVNFIKEYLDKYHFKILHDKTPLFCIDCSKELFSQIIKRLYKKEINCNDGYIANEFNKSKFFEEPMTRYDKPSSKVEREFDIRLLNIKEIDVLNEKKCDDLFVLSDKEFSILDLQDVNLEKIGAKRIEEIKYIMGMRDTYE
jgi:hypothetical protein